MRSRPFGWSKTLAQLGFRRVVKRQKRDAGFWGRRPRIESLETRQMLAGNTYVLTTLDDVAVAGTTTDSAWSLREALAHAAADGQADKDTIEFGNLSGVMTLTGQLTVNSDVNIVGPGADRLTINANGAGRALLVQGAGVLDVAISGVTIKGGRVTGDGGGIYNDGESLTLSSVVVTDNQATGTGLGGGLFSANGATTVINSTFYDNKATRGGAIRTQGFPAATLNIIGSTLYKNESTAGEGAISAYSTTTYIDRTTISDNKAGQSAGAIMAESSGQMTIVNSTIVENKAAYYGAGIYAHGTSVVTLHNTILAKNVSTTTTFHDYIGAISSTSSYNFIGSGVGGSTLGSGNIIGTASVWRDPLIAPLDYYGGTTKTHALLNGSEAIDKGNDSIAGASDQRGHSRGHDMPVNNGLGGASDIGAFEADDSLTLVVNNANDRNSAAALSGDLTLREALAKSRDIAGTERIEFNAALATSTLLLSLGELHIESNAIIAGPGANRFAIKSPGAHRVLVVDPGVTTTLSGLTITGGGGVTEAAGIFNWGRLTLDEATVSNNQATWSGSTSSSGGGIVTRNAAGRNDAALRLIDSTVHGNRATYAGGISATILDGGFLEIIGSTISSNTALNQANAGAGGGIIVSGSAAAPLTISNSTISGNSSYHSGGIRTNSATTNLSIIQSTITSNLANVSTGIAGGIHNAYASTITVHNSIIAGNSASNGTYRDIWGNIAGTPSDRSSNNILGLQHSTHLTSEARHSGLVNGVDGNQVGNETAVKIPQLTILADFGGPTKTHAILPTSPAIDAGNDLKAGLLDQRGFSRYDHPGVLNATADIGASEYRPDFVVTTLADADVPAGEMNLRQALLLALYTPGTETVSFSSGLFANGPATITLAYDGSDAGTDPDPLSLSDVYLIGPGADLLTISGADKTGVMAGNGTAIVEGLTITDGKSAAGGAISFYGTLTVRKSRITGNEATYYGGGIYSYGWLHVEDTEISDNKVTISSGGMGGGISHRNNYYHGGDHAFTISNSTISGNQVLGASGRGGGLYAYRMYVNYPSVELTNVTVSKNSAAVGGGMMSGYNYNYGTNNFIRANNSIIAGNTTLNLSTPSNVGAMTFAPGSKYNLIGYNGGTGGLTNGVDGNRILASGESDGLMPLDFYGGSTRTHAPLPTSPAVDAGGDLVASPTDQRGFARSDIAGAGVSVSDIGAAEYQAEFIVNSTADGPVEHGKLTLRSALLLARKAPGQNVIRFAPEVSGEILLTQGELTLDGVTIEGPGAQNLSINAQGLSRVFNVSASGPDPFTATIRGVRLTGGNNGAVINSTGMAVLTLDKVIVEGNSGGGVFAWYNPTITDSAIINNSGGPALDVRYGGGTIRNVTISGNASGGAAAGVYLYSFNGTFTNVTIADNTADVDDNDAGVEIGGVTLGGNSNAKFVNSIIARNTTKNNGAFVSADIGLVGANNTYNVASVNNLIGAVVSGTFPSGGNTNVTGVTADQLKLSPLGDYGGPTPTHALLPGSIAIDGGSNTAAGSIIVDQRGYERREDGNFDGYLTIDVGAYEFSLQPTLIVDTLVDESGGSAKLSLREAILRAAPGEVIGFAPELDGGTINLTGLGDLVIRKSLIITAHNLVNGLTIKGYDPTPTMQQGDGSRIFDVSGDDVSVMLTGMTLSGGDPYGDGGAIRSVDATLIVSNMEFLGNRAGRFGHVITTGPGVDDYEWIANGRGGAIFSLGDLFVTASTFKRNQSGPGHWFELNDPRAKKWNAIYSDDIYSGGNLSIVDSNFGDENYEVPSEYYSHVYGDFGQDRLFATQVGGIYVANSRGGDLSVKIDGTTIAYGKGIAFDGRPDGQYYAYNQVMDVTVRNSRISNNTTDMQLSQALGFYEHEFEEGVVPVRDISPYGTIAAIGVDLKIVDSVIADNGKWDLGDFAGFNSILSATMSRVSVVGSTFSGNTSWSGDKGILRLSRSEVTISGSSFTKNSVGVSSGILAVQEGGKLHVDDSNFSDNVGSIVNWQVQQPNKDFRPFGAGEVVIRNSIISGNSTTSGAGNESYNYGLISARIKSHAQDSQSQYWDWSEPYQLVIQDTTVSDNWIGAHRPLSWSDPSRMYFHPHAYAGAVTLQGRVKGLISGTTISGNVSSGSGAGVSVNGAQVRIEHSTISGNTSYVNGGGVYAKSSIGFDSATNEYVDQFSSVEIVSSTITNNVARRQGGGIFIDGGAYVIDPPYYRDSGETQLYLSNSIVAGNRSAIEEGLNPVTQRDQLIGRWEGPLVTWYVLAWEPAGVGATAANSNNTHDLWLSDVASLDLASSGNIIGVGADATLNTNDPRLVDAGLSAYDPQLPAIFRSGNSQGNQVGTVTNPLDPRLLPLGYYGGKTQTHALRLDSPAIDVGKLSDQTIVPISVASSTGATDIGDAQRLIDGMGATSPLAFERPGAVLSGWSTAPVTNGSPPTVQPDYFAAGGPTPVLTFILGGAYELKNLQAWALLTDEAISDSSAKNITLTFYRNGVAVGTPQPYLLSGEQQTIPLTTSVVADEVRLTVTDNRYDAGNGIPGGHAVGLSEVRFSGSRYTDQRNGPFLRDRNGNGVSEPTLPVDIGSFELQTPTVPTLVVSTADDVFDANYGANALSLREAIAWANINPGPDVITFSPSVFNFAQGDIIISLEHGELQILDDLTITAPVGPNGQRIVLDVSASKLSLGKRNLRGNRVFNVDDGAPGIDKSVALSGMKIIGGDIRDVGGGIRNYEDLTLTNVIVSGNASRNWLGDGGLKQELDGMENPSIEVYGSGGGIYVGGGSLNLNGSVVTGNATDYQGGGLAFVDGVPATISTSSVSNNVSDFYGGGMSFVGNASATITDSTISGNVAVYRLDQSGQIAGYGQQGAGGGIYAKDSALNLNRVTISGNSAFHGGGIAVSGSSHGPTISHAGLEATNVTISSNNAERLGGGISVGNYAEIALAHVTVAFNAVNRQDYGTQGGGGIYVYSQYDSLTITHSIIAQNAGVANLAPVAPSYPDYDFTPTDPDEESDLVFNSYASAGVVTNTLIGDIYGSKLFDRLHATGPSSFPHLTNFFGGYWDSSQSVYYPVLDANLDVLADNGGSTWTHALKVGSPAINKGTSALTVDQRGYTRTGTRDLGAFESQATAAGTPAMSLQLLNATTSLPEDVNVAAGVRVADLNVLHGLNLAYAFTLTGADASLFEAVGRELRLKTTAILDFETNPVLNVSVSAADLTSPTPRTAGPVHLTINLLDRNDAPVLDVGAGAQIPLSRDASPANNVGILASELLGNVIDQDANALKGLLIVSVDAAIAQYGRFEYTANGGSTWREVGFVSEDAALPLKADAQTRIRFVPFESFQGSLASALRFRAWDQTTGFVGEKTSVNSLGSSVGATVVAGELTRITASSSTNRRTPASAIDAQGGSFSVWEANGDVFGQRFNANGTATTSILTIAADAAINYAEPDVAIAVDGSVIVVWRSDEELFGRRLVIDETGAVQSTPFSVEVSSDTTTDPFQPKVSANSQGKFVVAWRESANDHSRLNAREYSITNTGVVETVQNGVSYMADFESPPLDLIIPNYVANSSLPTAVSDNFGSLELADDGSFVATWDHADWQHGYGRDVFVGRFYFAPESNGSQYYRIFGDIQTLQQTSNGDQKYSAAASYGNSYYVAWADFVDRSIHLKRYDLVNGVIASEEETVVYSYGDPTNSIFDYDAANLTPVSPTPASWINWVNSLDLAIDPAGRVGIAWSISDEAGLPGDESTLRVEWRSLNEITGEWVNHGSYENAGDWHSTTLIANDAGSFQLTALKPVTGTSGTRDEIFTQRFASDVAVTVAVSPRIGEPILINGDSGYRTNNQISPQVVIDAAGNSLHIWSGGGPSGTGIYARRFDPNGSPIGGSFFIAATSILAGARADVDSSGNVLITWRQTASGYSHVFGKTYTLVGQTLQAGAAQQLTFGSFSDQSHAVAFADDGSFMVAWSRTVSSGARVYTQKFTSAGVAVGSPLELLTTPIGRNQSLSGSHPLAYADGKFYAAFVDGIGMANATLYLRALDASGNAVGALQAVAQADAVVSELPDGSLEDQYYFIDSVEVAASGDGISLAWLTAVGSEVATDSDALEVLTSKLFTRTWNGTSWDGPPVELAAAHSVFGTQYGVYWPGSETITGPAMAADEEGRLGIAWSRSTGVGGTGTPANILSSVWRTFDEQGNSVISGPFTQLTEAGWSYLQLAGGPNGAFQLVGSTAVATYNYDVFMQRFSWGSGDVDEPALEENGALRINANELEEESLSVEVRNYGGQSYVWINGKLTSILASDVKELSITGRDGDDVIDLRKLVPASLPSLGSGGIVVRSGDGNDKIYVGVGKVKVEGGAGNDVYVISNKFAADVTIVDAAGNDAIEFADWQAGSAGALIALGYAGTQTVTRGPLSEVVKLTLVTGNEIESVTGGSQHVVFNRSQKPSSLIVNTAADELNLGNSNLSLREALMWAKLDAQADKISFHSSLSGGTIRLANLDGSADNLPDQLIIDSSVEIDAAGAPGLTISGEASGGSYRSRVFLVTAAGAATLRNFTITQGSATGADDDGGGVLVNGTLVLDRMTVSGNAAAGSGGGVAVMGTDAYLQMIDSTITANSAPYGAGINIESANAQISGSVIYANSSSVSPAVQGGGLRQFGASTVDLTNTTISGNFATTGGGFYTNGNGNLLKLTNVTVAFNRGDTGGGVYGDTTSVLARNTIIAKNTQLNGTTANDVGRPSPSFVVFVTGASGSTRNLIGDATNHGGLTATYDNIIGTAHATLDSTLAFNGGITRNHALDSTASNPAVNAPNATATVAPPIDQRGYVPGAGDSVRDIGATEYNGGPDTAPPLLPNLGVAVKENLSNGDVVATAAAGPNWRRFTYSIVSGNNSGAFKIDPNTGVITVADASLLDAERFPSYLLQIKATQISGGSGSDVGLVRINVDNVNEAPWVGTEQRTSVSENVFNGATIGFVIALDAELAALTYTKRSTTGGSSALEVDSKTGAIRVVDASKLKGQGSFELEVEVSDGPLKSIARINIEVASPSGTPSPGVVPIESTDFEVSHRKELAFNPIAGFDNANGLDFRVEFSTDGAAKLKVEYVNGKPAAVVENGKGDFTLGVLSLNPDGSLTYKPKDNLAKDGKLTVDEGSRFTATDSIDYKIFSIGDKPSKLAEGSFSVKVKNDLPVFLENSKSARYEPAVLESPLEVLRDVHYVLDVNDYFFDPDGDALEIVQLRNTQPGTYPSFSSFSNDDEPAQSATDLWAVAAGKLSTPPTLPPQLRKVYLAKSGTSDLLIDHDGVFGDLSNGYSTSHFPSRHTFEISITDNLPKSGKPVATLFQISVAPNLANIQPHRQSLGPIDAVDYQVNSPTPTKLKVDASKWTASAVARQSSREGRDLQTVGDATVDLNSGALIRRHELILDNSGGAAELSLPGLIYDSATVDPRPVIQATLKRQEGVWPSNIKATFRWFDHVNGDASGPRALPEIVKSYTVPESIKKLNDPSINSLEDVKEFMFSFQPSEAPLFTGVYSWEVEFEIIVENGASGSSGDEVLTLTQHGETPVVVQRKVTDANFKGSDGTNDQSPAWWNYAPAFGNGWALEGVPQLFVDDQFDGPIFDNDLSNDRLILHFPGQAPRLFRPGEGATGGFDRYDYGDGVFEPINANTSLKDGAEWGQLKSVSNGDIVYIDRDGVEYLFDRVEGYATNHDNSPVHAWRIKEIKAPGVKQPIEFGYAADSGATALRMTQIIGADNDGTSPGKANATTQIAYTGDFVNTLTLPDGEVVDFTIDSTANKYWLDEIEHINPQIGTTAVSEVDRVRHFTYDSAGRMATDKWFNNNYTTSTSSNDFRRSTTFAFNSNGLLTAVTVGIDSSGNGEAQSVYAVTSVAAEGLSGVSVINPKRIATVKTEASDLKSINEPTGAEKANGGDWLTNYTLDARGHVTVREEQFKPTSSSTATQLSVQRWTYDHLGSVKSFEDSHLREPRKSSETAAAYEARNAKPLGRMTYFSYDYEKPVNAAFVTKDGDYLNDKQSFDPNSPLVPVEQYDNDDYRGNVTRILSYAGAETFQYETRDAAEDAIGKLVKHVDARGVVTRYRYNKDGQTLEVRTIRGKDDAADASDAAKDYVETWTYFVSSSPWSPHPLEGLVETHTNPLGLETTYDYFEESRQLKQTTVVDGGILSSSSDDETIIAVYDYNGADTGYGFVESITTYRNAVSSVNKLSVAAFTYDATGLLRESTLASTTGAVLSSQEFDYDPDGAVTKVVNALNVATTNVYDKRGLLKSTTVADDAEYASYYLGAGMPVDIEQTTTYLYYKDGSLKETILPHAASLPLAEAPRAKRFIDPVARKEWSVTTGVATTTSFVSDKPSTVFKDMAVSSQYDVQGRLVAEKNLLTGAYSRYFYGDVRHDLPTRITEQANLGRAAGNEVFGINNIDDSALTDDLATILAYDRAGNTVFERQPGQASRAHAFDELGYLNSSKVLSSLGAEVAYKTDALGNVLEQKETRKRTGGDTGDVVNTYQYDEQGRLRRAIDAESQVTEYDYAFELLDPTNAYNNSSIPNDEVPNDLVRTVTTKVVNGPLPGDDLLTKQYVDAAGQVVRETSPLGATTLRVHDKAGNVTHEILHPAAGDTGVTSRIVEHKYDGLNRLRETIQHGSTIDSAKISSFVDYFLQGDIASYNWDVITTGADGATTWTDYDSLGNPIAIVQDDPDINVNPGDAPLTLYSYTYLASQLAYAVTTRTTSSRGQADLGSSSRVHDETRVSRQVLNTHGDLLVASEWTSGTLASDALADTGSLIGAGFQLRQTNRYSAPGQVSVSADGEWKKTIYEYDEATTGTGQIKQITSPNGEKTLYDYDSAGNRTAMRQVRGEYDKTVKLLDVPGDLPDSITTWTYDKVGRMTSEVIDVDVVNPGGGYDVRGLRPRSWVYSGLTTTYTDRDGRVSTKGFDLATRTSTDSVYYGGSSSYLLTTVLNSDGSLKRTYDSWTATIGGTSRTGDDSEIAFTYDEYGRQLTTTETFDFDGSASLTSKLTNVYDNAGRVSTGTWALNSTNVLTNTYRYDDLSRVTGISQDVVAGATSLWSGGQVGGDKSIAVAYNSNGSREKVSRYIATNYGTEVSDTDYDYANDGSITDLVHRRLDDNVVIASYLNVRDGAGRAQLGGRVLNASNGLTPTKLKDERVNYHYDDKGQLTSISPLISTDTNDLKPINSDAYNYDDTGNRINPSSVVKRQNRLSSDGNYHYEYDGEGRLVRKVDLIANGPDHTTNGYYYDYSWDHRGRLLAVEYHSQGSPGALIYRVDYGYDALGRQIAKKVDYTNPATTDEFLGYVSDGSRPVFEVNLAAGANVNKITSSYFYAPGGDAAAVDQAGKTIWNFADASGTVATVGYASPAGAHAWKLLHRNYDQFGQEQKFTKDDDGAQVLYLGDDADAALLAAPEFFAGQAWDEEAKLYDFGSRWYDPFAGRYTADGGGANGYRFMENDPTRDRFVGGGLSDADLDSIYGDSWWNGLQRSIGETVRWGVGDKALASASNTTLYLGVGVTSVVAAVGIVYAAPFLASGAQAAGAWAASSVTAGAQAAGTWAAGSIAAGAKAAGVGVGTYLTSQAGLSAVQTGVETAAAWGFGGDVSVSGVLGSFATNFGVNSLTGGSGVFARHSIQIAAGTAYDVARGENFGSSLFFNTVGSVVGEAMVKGIANKAANLYWHGSKEGVEAATKSGLFAHGTGNGTKYWATTRGKQGLLTELLIGGNDNIDSLIPPRMSKKGGFESVYKLTTEETANFNRAWGFQYSWNPWQWYKGATGQFYFHPGTVSWGQRGIEVGRGAAMTSFAVALHWTRTEISDWWNDR